MKRNGEKGQALPLVMIAIILGGLVLPPFLGHVDSSIIGSKNYEGMLYEQYACDSGAEHAIWSLTDGIVADEISGPGDTISYLLPESVNNLTANVTISNSYQILAQDNFNSGGWTGGSGWLDDWTHSGESAVTNTGSPYEGSYHLRLRSDTGIVKRSINLSHQINVYLSLWVKVDSFETGKSASCQVSSNGANWTTVYTWTKDDSDNIYRHYLISLAPYEMTNQFWISFVANMGNTADYFYVDKLEVDWLASSPEITASDDFESGDETGGTGWLQNWTITGNAAITASGTPYQSSYHLGFTNNNGVAKRPVNLSNVFMATIQLWAKVSSFEGGDEATCQVSSDGDAWTTVYTWTRGVDDSTYHFYTIDLSGLNLTGQFWISFHGNMNQADDYFYVDNVNIVKIVGYGVTVTAGDSTLKAVVTVDDVDAVTVLFWSFV
jgi:hypothetical protein